MLRGTGAGWAPTMGRLDGRAADAQATLGLWYYQGKPLPQDRKQAAHWLTRAAQGGNLRLGKRRRLGGAT